MSENSLTQEEADNLINLEKHHDIASLESNPIISLPDLGGRVHVPLICINKRETFLLDVSRISINLSKETKLRTHKETKQLRTYQTIILLRLDMGGRPHRNPDDAEISSPHLHIYREGYGDKWAYPVPLDKFPNLKDSWLTLYDFMQYCNITKYPPFQKGLWT